MLFRLKLRPHPNQCGNSPNGRSILLRQKRDQNEKKLSLQGNLKITFSRFLLLLFFARQTRNNAACKFAWSEMLQIFAKLLAFHVTELLQSSTV